MSQLDDDLLQRYYDGELSPVEERSVRTRVEADPEAQRKLKQMARLSEALQDAARQMGREVDADALFAGISAGIAKDAGRGAPGKLEVITGEWVEHKRPVWVPLAAAGAIAAAALLTVIGGPTAHPGPVAETHGEPTGEPVDPPEQPGAKLAAAEQADAATETVHGSSVENVDFGNNAGTVFEIETRGMTTAVVWISDESEEDAL